MIRWSETARWQRANDRFHRLMRCTPECARHLEAMRDHIRDDAGKAVWEHVTATRIDAFCEWLADFDDDDRAGRVETRLTRAKERACTSQ